MKRIIQHISAWLHDQDPELKLEWLADGLGLSKHTVKKWDQIPPRHCKSIERLTRGAFPAHKTRPDVFGDKQNTV